MKGKILIFDRETSHFSEDINRFFDKYSSNYVLIPPGQIRFFYPLEIGVNKVFKKIYTKNIMILNIQLLLKKKLLFIIYLIEYQRYGGFKIK